MTTVIQLIQDAYRESNLIPIGAAPTAAEETEGLRLLNRIFFSVIGNEAGDPLEELPIGTNNIQSPSGYPFERWTSNTQRYVPLNKRLMLNLTEARTLSLDPAPQEGSRFAFRDLSNNLATFNFTIVANGRKIAGVNQIVFNTNGLAKEYFYRADLGEWKEVPVTFIAADEWFFPSEFDEMFITSLAMRLNPRHGQSMTQESMAVYQRSMRQFKARYTQNISMRSELGLLYLSSVTLQNTSFGLDPTSIFNNGNQPW